MFRAAICDDDPRALDQMTRITAETFAAEQLECSMTAFSSGEELLAAHRQQPFDILFLDILMPGRSGFDIAKDVRRLSDKTLLLFVTSQDALVYDSFHYHPFYFLRKGEDFAQSLAEAAGRIVSYLRRNTLVTLDLGVGELRSVCAQEILYLKSGMHFLEYHMAGGGMLRVRQTIAEAAEALAGYGLMQIHRQYIVNLYHVQKLDVSRYPKVLLTTGEALPLGRKFKAQAAAQYTERMRYL